MGLPPMRQAPSQAERARREAALMRGLPRDTTQEAMNIADEELAAVPTSDTDSESSYLCSLVLSDACYDPRQHALGVSSSHRD